VGTDLRDTGVVKNVAELTTQGTGTRERVRSLLLALGPSTAATLSEQLGVSPAAIRKHLDALLLDGTVTTREQRIRGLRGRGRPARLYALTDAGHAGGPASYDDLATSALRFLADSAGESAVERFAESRVAELEVRYADRLRDVPRADRPAVLAEALSDDGYAATTSEHGVGVQLCQHHCPVQHVAAEFPQLCDAETAAIGRLLDVHVQRLATIAHGDGVCTTFIPTGKATR
jgi:predicted ArsR family transcriptional regulator